MQRLVLTILACCLITAFGATSQEQPSPTGCCLAQYGYPCDANSLPKQQCLGGDNVQCCPTSTHGTFQCCVQPFFQCNFTAMQCQKALTFPADPAPTTIRVGTFAVSLSYLFAQLNGYFQDEGLIVNTTIVGGSVAQFQGVLNGQYDVIITGADNVVNYVENAHPPFNSFNQHFDMLAFLGESGSFNQTIFFNPNGPYPNIQSFQTHTPAKTLSPARLPIVGVDSPTSGFAFLVYTVFSSFGLKNGTDYTIGVVGGGNARLAALENGKIDAAILGGENTLQAYKFGLTGQVNVFDVVGSVEGTIYAANRSYTDPYGIVGLPNPVLVRLTRAIYKGLQYVLDPANQANVTAVLYATNASVNPPAFYQINVNPPTGLYPGGNIDQIGMYNIINLRRQYNGFENYTSDARVCNLSQPRGNRNTFRSTPSVDWLYQLDTLYESVLTLGQTPVVTPRYPTCNFPGGSGANGILDDNNSAQAQSLPIMVILSFVAVLLFCVL